MTQPVSKPMYFAEYCNDWFGQCLTYYHKNIRAGLRAEITLQISIPLVLLYHNYKPPVLTIGLARGR